MRQMLDGAIAEGVARLLLIGTHPREPHTFKGRMRKEQEDLLLEADAAHRIKGCVLRLPDFYGPGVDKSFIHGAIIAAVKGGTANMVGPLDKPHEFVFVPDVGPVVLKLLETPAAFGHVWHLGGAGTTSQRGDALPADRPGHHG